ncbi:MAG: HD-GYP domain-containing protein [Desulfobaccales bacterium]
MSQDPKKTKQALPAGPTPPGRQHPGPPLDFPLRFSEIVATSGDDEEQGYLPLPFGQLPGEGEAPFDIYLKVKLKDAPAPHFMQCCSRGQPFPPEWRRKFEQVRISCIYFPAADMDAVLGYLQGRLAETLESPQRGSLEKAIVTYDVLQVWTRNFFASPQGQADQQFDLSLQCIDGLVQLLQQEKGNLDFVFDIRRYDQDRYTHSLNVCLLGLGFVSFLNWEAEKARAFGLGALLHDIGLTEVSLEVLNKKTALTVEERELVEKHPAHGFRLLKNFGSISHDALMMVLQHHENGDGSGYPQKLHLAAIHTWAKILRIVDTYEAMTATRPWRMSRPPQETLWAMRDEWQRSQIYDPAYLKAFIKFLGTKRQ